MEVLTLRKYWVEADCWKEMPTHSTRSAVAMSSSMRSYTVSGVMTWSAATQNLNWRIFAKGEDYVLHALVHRLWGDDVVCGVLNVASE